MPPAVYEITSPASGLEKRVHAVDRVTTVIFSVKFIDSF
jgi:hypothetical protein